jgi:hypothetical protein
MLSALVLLHGAESAPPEAIVRTLTALVPAAVEGVVRDLALCAPRETKDLLRICDHAGCDFLALDYGAAMGGALTQLKEPRAFILRAGRAPQHGYLGEVADLLAAGERAAVLRDAPHNLATRLAPALSPVSALIAARADLQEAPLADVGRLAARLKGARTLKARMIGA